MGLRWAFIACWVMGASKPSRHVKVQSDWLTTFRYLIVIGSGCTRPWTGYSLWSRLEFPKLPDSQIVSGEDVLRAALYRSCFHKRTWMKANAHCPSSGWLILGSQPLTLYWRALLLVDISQHHVLKGDKANDRVVGGELQNNELKKYMGENFEYENIDCEI